MLAVEAIYPGGKMVVFASVRQACKSLGFSTEYVKRLATKGGYTQTGIKLQFRDTFGDTKRRAVQVMLSIGSDFSDWCDVQALRLGVPKRRLLRGLLENAIARERMGMASGVTNHAGLPDDVLSEPGTACDQVISDVAVDAEDHGLWTRPVSEKKD